MDNHESLTHDRTGRSRGPSGPGLAPWNSGNTGTLDIYVRGSSARRTPCWGDLSGDRSGRNRAGNSRHADRSRPAQTSGDRDSLDRSTSSRSGVQGRLGDRHRRRFATHSSPAAIDPGRPGTLGRDYAGRRRQLAGAGDRSRDRLGDRAARAGGLEGQPIVGRPGGVGLRPRVADESDSGSGNQPARHRYHRSNALFDQAPFEDLPVRRSACSAARMGRGARS